MEDPFIDSLRKLTAEELLQDMFRRYKQLNVALGELKSELDEKIYEVAELEKRIKQLEYADPELRKEIKKEKRYQELSSKIRELNKTIHKLRNDKDYLISKLHNQ